jgi:hypothetical protein
MVGRIEAGRPAAAPAEATGGVSIEAAGTTAVARTAPAAVEDVGGVVTRAVGALAAAGDRLAPTPTSFGTATTRGAAAAGTMALGATGAWSTSCPDEARDVDDDSCAGAVAGGEATTGVLTGAETVAWTIGGTGEGVGDAGGATEAGVDAGAGAASTPAPSPGEVATGVGVETGPSEAAGSGAPTAGGGSAIRAGSNVVGSTYPWSWSARRTPSCTYGPLTPGSSPWPRVPTLSPSATVAPFATAIDPSSVSVTDQPSGVRMVTDFPLPGTVPANVTTPAAGATTVSPAAPPMSIPRCWPAAYGWAGSNENGSRTEPLDGHVHASAGAAKASAATSTTRNRRRRIEITSSVVGFENECSITVGDRGFVVKTGYSFVTKTSGRARCATRR